MTWENVPWMVDKAAHSAEVGRLVGYAAVGRAEGVVGPTDCKVTASGIPDANVHIATGAAAVLNRGEGGSSQAYLLRNVGDEVKALAPQGSSGVRYDLVCVVVKDPQYAGQPAPASVVNGPYLETRVYPNVAATTRSLAEVDSNQTGLALALVKFDASDGTIYPADITDLRRIVKPERYTEKGIFSGTGAVNVPANPGVSPPQATTQIRVPEWATHVQLEGRWNGIQCLDASGTGNGQSQGTAGVELGPIQTGLTQWLIDGTGANKPITFSTAAAGEFACSQYAGQLLNLRGILDITSQTNMTARTTQFTSVVLEATFIQKAI